MAKTNAKAVCKFTIRQQVLKCVLSFYLLRVCGAHGTDPMSDSKQSPDISRLLLTVETSDGHRYTYQASPSIAITPVQPLAHEGWLQSFGRNLALGVSVPLVLLGVREWFSWLKQRYIHRGTKEQARVKARQRRRLLRNIYALQDELQNLEGELKEMKDALGNEEDAAVRAQKKMRVYDLKSELEDLRLRLRELYTGSSSQAELASSINGLSGGSSLIQDEHKEPSHTRQENRYARKQSNSADHITAAGSTVSGAEEIPFLASSTLDSTVTGGDQPQGKRVFKQDKSDRQDFEPGRLNRHAKQSRLEIVRQLVEEVPGMPPQEVLRIAENVTTRGR